METLNSYQQRLDEIWKAARWITAVVSSARDKQLKSGLPLSVLFAYAESSKLSRTPPELDAVYDVDKDDNGARQRLPSSNDGSDPDMEDNSDVGYHSDQSLDRTAGHVDPNPLSAIKNGKIPALNFHALPAAVANPNYELLNNLTKRNPVASRRRVGFLLDNQMCEKRVANLRKSFGANNVSASEDISDSNCNVNAAAVVRRSDRPPNDYGVTSRRRSGSFSDLPTAIVNNVKLYSEHYHKFDCSPDPEPGCSNNGVRRSAPECVQLRDSLKLFKNSGRKNNSPPVRVDNFGVLRVYAAYPCGLVKDTSVKLQVTQKTTSKEVTALVVQQLSKSAKSKGYDGPYYEDGDLNELCLVAVIGARERCLRDDFAPLDLQNPWSKGKLFVRRRHDLLAALEYGKEAKV